MAKSLIARKDRAQGLGWARVERMWSSIDNVVTSVLLILIAPSYPSQTTNKPAKNYGLMASCSCLCTQSDWLHILPRVPIG